MATREQLYQALQRADASGDTEAARRIAQALAGAASMPAAKQPTYAETLEDEAKKMGFFETAAVGAGRGFHDVGQGLKQIALGSKNIPFTSANLIAERVPALAQWMDKEAAKQKQQQANELEQFAALEKASPVAAIGGRVVGNIAAMPVPAGRAPTLAGQIGLGALSGAAMGSAQYVPEGGSRAMNTAIGGAAGAVLPAVVPGLKLTAANVKMYAGKLKDAMPNVSQASRERFAAKMIRDAAQDPAKLSRMSGPLVPGTQQTLAEATDDAGIAGLQRGLANMQGGMGQEMAGKLGQMAEQNNAVRVNAIREGFGGANEGAARAIEEARDRATLPLLEAARKVRGVNVAPVTKHIDRILASRKGNETVSNVVQQVKDALTSLDSTDVRTLHNLRQDLGYIISGQNTKAGTAGPAATRELLSIRNALDAQIGKSAPEFRQFLRQYADLSKGAGQVRMGDELLGKSFATLDSAGNPVLSPAQFARASNDLDRVAKQATGFRKETAERLMTPEQRALVGNIRGDLDRYSRSRTAGLPVNSATAQNQAGMARIQDTALGGDMTSRMMPSSLNSVLPFMDTIAKHYGNKSLQVVQEAMLNPARAREILARFPPAQRRQVQSLLENPQFLQFMEQSGRVGAPIAASAAVGVPSE